MSQISIQSTDNKDATLTFHGGNLEALKSREKFVIVVGGGGSGKAENVENRVPTPNGWRRFGDLQAGDKVFSEKGLPTTVVEIFPQGEKQLYKVIFNDDCFVEVTEDHLWQVRAKLSNDWQVLTTKQIISTIDSEYYIPTAEPINYQSKVDSKYYWNLGYDYSIFCEHLDHVKITVYENLLLESIDNKIEFLKGFCFYQNFKSRNRNYIEFYDTASLEFFQELVLSLGGKFKSESKKFYFSLPFELEINYAEIEDRKIVSIEESKVGEAMCIAVDNPTSLYLTKDYICTHNTWAMCLKMHLYCLMYPGVQVLLCRKSLPALRNSAVKTYQKILEMTGYVDKVRVLGETRPTEFHYEHSEQEHNGKVYKGVSKIVLSQIDMQGKALGAEYDMIYINQPDTEGLTEDEYTLVASRARLSNAPYRQILSDPNPANEQHWLLKGSLPQADGKPPKWRLIPSRHEDNPYLYDREKGEWTEMGKEHLAQLAMLPEHLRKSQLEGKWFSTEGTVFGNSWNPAKHVLYLSDPRALELGISKYNDETEKYQNIVSQGWEHYVAIDWGGADPWVILLICKHPIEDKYILHKHIYIVESDIIKVAELTKQMLDGYNIKEIIADRGRVETTFFEKVLGMNITNAKKGAGSAIDAINVINTELLSDRWLFVSTDESLYNTPSLELVNSKKPMGLIEELPNLKLNPKTNGIAAHQADHAFDSFKYYCRYLTDRENQQEVPIFYWLD